MRKHTHTHTNVVCRKLQEIHLAGRPDVSEIIGMKQNICLSILPSSSRCSSLTVGGRLGPIRNAICPSALSIFNCSSTAATRLLSDRRSCIMQEERAAHQGCRLKHGRQGGGDTSREDRWRETEKVAAGWERGQTQTRGGGWNEHGDGGIFTPSGFERRSRETGFTRRGPGGDLSPFTVRPSWVSCHNGPVNPS